MFLKNICEVNDGCFKTKIDLIQYLANLAHRENKISNVKQYIDAILAREDIVSTAIGYGIAIPHGASDTVRETFVGCLKLNKPIMWDTEEVSLVFMIGVPNEKRENEHIKILAKLSRALMREEFRGNLNNASTNEEFYNHIKQLETM